MGYDFTITDYYQIKYPEKDYPWPCDSDLKRTITIYDDDILTKTAERTYTKHTGICCTHILIPDEDVIYKEKTAHLRLI